MEKELGTDDKFMVDYAWIPDMSDGCQANKSMFLCSMSAMRQCSWLVKSHV